MSYLLQRQRLPQVRFSPLFIVEALTDDIASQPYVSPSLCDLCAWGICKGHRSSFSGEFLLPEAQLRLAGGDHGSKLDAALR